ncbi:hypothetical protein RHMOL_Rhmol05G0190000 [Rhododendron molle]|uniref:Uncharacterized protein n=1 Tax=Rhododendron molle TaxID=49168 RepID=A0ACC0NQK2_RHOML|nr:hypothetical protein RHMOL_Rhmol05G0190000 [Rhododendron molle]
MSSPSSAPSYVFLVVEATPHVLEPDLENPLDSSTAVRLFASYSSEDSRSSDNAATDVEEAEHGDLRDRLDGGVEGPHDVSTIDQLMRKNYRQAVWGGDNHRFDGVNFEITKTWHQRTLLPIHDTTLLGFGPAVSPPCSTGFEALSQLSPIQEPTAKLQSPVAIDIASSRDPPVQSSELPALPLPLPSPVHSVDP